MGASGKGLRAVVTMRTCSPSPALVSTVVNISLSSPSIAPACIIESRSGPLDTGTNSTSIPSSVKYPSCCATYIGTTSVIGSTPIFRFFGSSAPAARKRQESNQHGKNDQFTHISRTSLHAFRYEFRSKQLGQCANLCLAGADRTPAPHLDGATQVYHDSTDSGSREPQAGVIPVQTGIQLPAKYILRPEFSRPNDG